MSVPLKNGYCCKGIGKFVADTPFEVEVEAAGDRKSESVEIADFFFVFVVEGRNSGATVDIEFGIEIGDASIRSEEEKSRREAGAHLPFVNGKGLFVCFKRDVESIEEFEK